MKRFPDSLRVSSPAKRRLTFANYVTFWLCFYIVWGQFTGSGSYKMCSFSASSMLTDCWPEEKQASGSIVTDWVGLSWKSSGQNSRRTRTLSCSPTHKAGSVQSSSSSSEPHVASSGILSKQKIQKKENIYKSHKQKAGLCFCDLSGWKWLRTQTACTEHESKQIKRGLGSAQRSRLAVHHRTTQHPDKVNKTQRMRTTELQTLRLFILHSALRF